MINIPQISEIEYKDLKFQGHSLSGIRTSIAMSQFSLCFDVSQGYPFVLHLKKYFITHGHLDHSAGIPYIISQKAMFRENAPIFYMPKSLVNPLDSIMQQWMKIEEHQYQYLFEGIDENSLIPINGNHFVKPFKTVHRIESFGYTLFKKNKKIKDSFKNIQKEQIIEAKKQGIEVNQETDEPLVSFTGDTQIECIDISPEIKNSKILFIECTYLDNKKSVEHAKKWGHLHLDELTPRLKELNSEKIFLIHLSSRYNLREAQEILNSKIPKNELERVQIWKGL